jgi:PAS domain S-box-containing protein
VAQPVDPDLVTVPVPRERRHEDRDWNRPGSLFGVESDPRLPPGQLQAVIDNSPDLMIRYDRDGTRLFANRALADLYGVLPTDLVGTRLGEPVHGSRGGLEPDSARELREAVLRAFDQVRPVRVDVTYRDRGDSRVMEVQLVPEVEPGGTVIDVLGIGRDVTAVKDLERELWDGNRSYRELFNNAVDQMILLEIHPGGRFRILDVNPAMERVLSRTREEVVGRFQDDLYEPHADQILADGYRACIDAGAPVEGEIVLERPEGPRTFRTTTVPARDGTGRIVRVATILRDVSEQRREEAARLRLGRALRTLSSGNEALVRATDEASLLTGMARVAVGVGGYRRAWIGYSDPSTAPDLTIDPSSPTDEELPVTTVGWASSDPEETAADRPSLEWLGPPEPLRVALESGQPRVCHPGQGTGPWSERRSSAEHLEIGSCLTLPLMYEGNAFGVFVIHAVQADAFSDDELRLLTELSADLAYGIHNLRARAEQDRNEERARQAMNATVQALADTTELRDPYTAGHQRRVAQLADAVGHRMGMSEDRVAGLYLASTIHDIGKISVPAEILGRPGGLSDLEYSMVQQHVTAAYELLRGIEFPWPVADIVLQHHERCDGSGYPAGLTSKDLLLESRILAVCDVVEAMSSHRPYRPGLGMGAAVRELESHRGTLYDAEVVDACVSMLREGSFRFV